MLHLAQEIAHHPMLIVGLMLASFSLGLSSGVIAMLGAGKLR